LISDIVMPGKNGLELLKLIKKKWPLTKAIMMTAYASTDTAMKAIRLGALDYVPKPFTPAEMRSTVEKALGGALTEVAIAPEERDAIDAIDIDIPFDAKEVADQVGEEYMNMLGRSGMPIVEVKISEPLENFCEVASMVCDIFKKLGATCKAGTKTGACPQKKVKKSRTAAVKQTRDLRKLISIDQPYIYDEVVAFTGPEFVNHLYRDRRSNCPHGGRGLRPQAVYPGRNSERDGKCCPSGRLSRAFRFPSLLNITRSLWRPGDIFFCWPPR
jgi:hypothetical protein